MIEIMAVILGAGVFAGTPEQEHQARERGHEVALLRWHWDGAYEFGHDGSTY
jgi:hypothetical protein